MNEFGHQKEKQNIIISDVKSRKPLSIFKTTEDKYGRDISVMSDFFDGFRVIIVTVANSLGNIRVFELLPKLKTKKYGWCIA